MVGRFVLANTNVRESIRRCKIYTHTTFKLDAQAFALTFGTVQV